MCQSSLPGLAGPTKNKKKKFVSGFIFHFIYKYSNKIQQPHNLKQMYNVKKDHQTSSTQISVRSKSAHPNKKTN